MITTGFGVLGRTVLFFNPEGWYLSGFVRFRLEGAMG